MRTQNTSRVSKKQRLVWLLLLAIVVAVALLEVPRAAEQSGSRPRLSDGAWSMSELSPTATEQA
jgi:hypothetical protein